MPKVTRQIALATIALHTTLLVGCGSSDETQNEPLSQEGNDTAREAQTTTDYSSSPESELDSTDEPIITDDCESEDTAQIRLHRIELENGAAGHPSGAKTVRAFYEGDPLAGGQVSFNLVSGEAVRGVKFLDGQQISNHVMVFDNYENQEIKVPVIPEEGQIAFAIPASAGDKFTDNWTFSAAVEGRDVSTCTAKGTGE